MPDQLPLLLIPATWTALLRRIQEVCPSAVLAGGALRDLDNGRDVKDLDVFIYAETEGQAQRALEELGDAGFGVSWTLSDTTVYPEDQNLEVIAVMDLVGFELPVQLIFTNWDTARIVDRFDYGICRLSWNGTDLARPAEYDEDKRDKVFRLRRDRPTSISMRGSVHRYARLVSKYPGWTWWPFEPIDCLAVFEAL